MRPRTIFGYVAGVLAVLVGIVFLFSILFMWPFKSTPADQVGLSYGGGLFEAQHFQGIVQPGHGFFFNGWADPLYLYPTTQRNYIISKRAGEGDLGGSDFIPAPSSDRIEVDYEVAVYFKLNTSKLYQFQQNIGFKYAAWTEDGWKQMLNDSFRQQIENSLQEESRKYPVDQIYSNPTTLQTIQTEVGTALRDNIAHVLGDDYFCGPTYVQGSKTCPDFEFVIKRVTIPPGVQESFQENRTSQIAVQTEKNKVKQAKFQAQSIKSVSDALRKAPDSYTLLQAIQSGKITFWVIPSNSNVTLPTQSKG